MLSSGSIVRNACRVQCGECCTEDPNFSFQVEGEGKTCRWLSSEEKRDKWCEKWINGVKVMKACPIRCGNCCVDDPDYIFKRNGRGRSCQFLSRLSPDTREVICNQFNNGQLIRNKCKETCGICEDDLEIPNLSPVIPPTSRENVYGSITKIGKTIGVEVGITVVL